MLNSSYVCLHNAGSRSKSKNQNLTDSNLNEVDENVLVHQTCESLVDKQINLGSRGECFTFVVTTFEPTTLLFHRSAEQDSETNQN